MRKYLAIALGWIILKITKFLKIGGGSAAPGLYALKVCPNLIDDLIKNIPTNIVITGTNGKTTTARILAHFAEKSNLKVLRNSTGSNLERGVASTLINQFGKKFDLGIWELDEAAFNNLALKLYPKVIIFLNVFRDQLDRYGEVDSIVQNWAQTVKSLDKNSLVLINGDDKNLLLLKKAFQGQVKTFGVKDYVIEGEKIVSAEESINLDYDAHEVTLKGLQGSSFEINTKQNIYHVELPLPGIYHIYDFIAAFSAGININLPLDRMIVSLEDFSPAFGRVEKLSFGYIFLIKNPVGATQVFETIKDEIKEKDRLLLILNDKIADGTDVSWIWDADFNILQSSSQVLSRDFKIFISGTRAYDLALRLKYAGFDPKCFIIEDNLKRAFTEARKGLEGRLFILPTYTALLELQRFLTKLGLKKNYWEDN